MHKTQFFQHIPKHTEAISVNIIAVRFGGLSNLLRMLPYQSAYVALLKSFKKIIEI